MEIDGNVLIHSLEVYIETYIDNRSFFFCGHPFSPFAHPISYK